jgi:hypothetical protein
MEFAAKLSRCISGVSLGIGLLVLLNSLKIPFYLYYPHVTQTILTSATYDLYFFLASSVSVPCTLVLNKSKLSRSGLFGILTMWAAALTLTVLGVRYAVVILYATVAFGVISSVSKSELRGLAVGDVLVPALSIFVLIESSPLYYWVGAALNPHAQVGMLSQELELNLTFSLFPLAIGLMLLLLFSWIALTIRFRRKPLVIRYEPTAKTKPKIRLLAASLDLFAILAIITFFYSYLAGQGWIVGVDSYWIYLNPLNALAGLTPYQAFATSYTHGLYVGFLYLIELATRMSAFSIVKYAPLILAIATASTVFLAILKGGWNHELAILSAVCTLLWLPTTLGIYAGIQANWVAYLLWMLFLSLYFRSGVWSVITFVVEGLISFAILVIHPWTWGIFFTTLLITILVSWRTPWKDRPVHGALAALIIALPVGAGAYGVLPNLRYDLMNTLGLYASPFFQPGSLLTFGGAMQELFVNWTPFIPPLLLLLCLVGVYSLSGRQGGARNYVVAWIVTWFIGSILVAPTNYNPTNPGLSETGLWRMLYVSPLPILLALGLEKCLEISKRWQIHSLGEKWPLKSHLTSLALIAASAGLFLFDDPLVRLAILTAVVVAVIVVEFRFPRYRTARSFLAVILILLLVNAAFRSLYPLLLDPHSLFGPVGAQ